MTMTMTPMFRKAAAFMAIPQMYWDCFLFSSNIFQNIRKKSSFHEAFPEKKEKIVTADKKEKSVDRKCVHRSWFSTAHVSVDCTLHDSWSVRCYVDV